MRVLATKKSDGILWRLAPSLVGLTVYLVLVAVRRVNFKLFQKLLHIVPFGDMRPVLLALPCWRQDIREAL